MFLSDFFLLPFGYKSFELGYVIWILCPQLNTEIKNCLTNLCWTSEKKKKNWLYFIWNFIVFFHLSYPILMQVEIRNNCYLFSSAFLYLEPHLSICLKRLIYHKHCQSNCFVLFLLSLLGPSCWFLFSRCLINICWLKFCYFEVFCIQIREFRTESYIVQQS